MLVLEPRHCHVGHVVALDGHLSAFLTERPLLVAHSVAAAHRAVFCQTTLNLGDEDAQVVHCKEAHSVGLQELIERFVQELWGVALHEHVITNDHRSPPSFSFAGEMDVVGGVAFVDLSVVDDDVVHLSEVGGGISGHVAAVGFTIFVPHQGQRAWYSFCVEVVALCADNRLLVPLEVEVRQVRIEGAVGFEIYDLHD